MKTIIGNLSDVKINNKICSVKISPSKKWIRTLKDKNGNDVNIHKLKVERSLNSGDTWILCLYHLNSNEQKYIFYLDLNKIKIRYWS